MYVDPSGHVVVSALIAGAIIGFAIGFTTAVFNQMVFESIDFQDVDFFEAVFDGAYGAINGILAASGVSTVISVVLGVAMGGISSIGKDLIFNEGNIDWEKAGISAIVGGVSGAIAGAGANNIKSGAHITKFVNSRNILNKTIANGTKKIISRQINAVNIHATQLIISGLRYFVSSIFGVLIPQIQIRGG